MKLAVLLIALAAGAPFAGAVPLLLAGDMDFSGFPAKVSVDGQQEETIYVSEGSLLDVPYDHGAVTVHVIGESIYSGHHAIREGENTVTLRPSARISGRVIDERDNLLQHVPLRILCSSPIPGTAPTETDDVGFFTIQEVGFGSCDISAIVGGRAVTYHLDVNESKHHIISIRVEKNSGFGKTVTFAILALAAIAVGIAALALLKRGAVQEKRNGKDFSKRQEDLIATLPERERLIVTDLFYSGKLTQSQLRHRTRLPKSTLHRTLQSLERKNIAIHVTEHGVKKVALTDFFMQ